MAPIADPIVVRRGDISQVSVDPIQGSENPQNPAGCCSYGECAQSRPANGRRRPAFNRSGAKAAIIVPAPSAGSHSVAVCDQLRAVDKRRLTRISDRLSNPDLRMIEEGIRRILEL